MSKIAVIGAGFSGLSAASYLAAAGHEVHVFEKNTSAGGRARQLITENGYVFDMGPSWYWMPDVFERFFNDFDYDVADFYTLKLLDPSFDLIFPDKKTMEVPADYGALRILFESMETGAGIQLDKFMQEAGYKYEVGMKMLSYKPGLSLTEFANWKMARSVFRLNLFSSFSRHVRKFFTDKKLIALMEFPVLFLGAVPENTPALYSLMNFAGLKLGTWYPIGGFGKVISSLQKLASLQGAMFHFNAPVEKIQIENSQATGLIVNDSLISFDAIVASADYNHVEKMLLPEKAKNYNDRYWNKKIFAPSCLIFYIGVSKKINNLHHHTLFFDEDLVQHSIEIYKDPQWPSRPLFYVCCPSVSEDGLAPRGHENLFILMPVASGLQDTEPMREKYFEILMTRLESHLKTDIRSSIDYKKSYCIADFVEDYHSYKGNAYGLANTLLQTAVLKPKIRNRKISNLFYAGQLTVPGPGVPPSLISGKIVANELIKHLKKQNHETAI